MKTPVSPENFFTASQLASVLNGSRKDAHRLMASADRHIATKLVRGVQARCWPVAAIPSSLAARLSPLVSRHGYGSIAQLLSAPPKPWEPTTPLAQIAPAAIEKAELRCRILAPILAARDAQIVPVAVLVRRAAAAFTDHASDYKTGGERIIRAWIETAIERDRNLYDWRRAALYLDPKPPRKQPGDDAAALAVREAGGEDLAETIAKVLTRMKVQAASEPTAEERGAVWAATFRRYDFLKGKDVPEAKAKKLLLRVLASSGLSLFADTPTARSRAWDRNLGRCSSGLDPELAFADGRQTNGRAAVFELNEEEEAALRHCRLKKGSVNLAIDAFYRSAACRPETRELIEKYRDEAAARRRMVEWPMSLRRAAETTAEQQAKFRGSKKYQEVEAFSHRGMYFLDETGQRVDLRPNSIFESDDVSINEPFTFLDPDTGDTRIGRQTLCTQDVFSASWLAAMPVGRSRDAYRVEDIADHMLAVVETYGLPDLWRLERGPWENNFIDGVPLPGGERWGGLDALFQVSRTYKPKQKGGIEGGFNFVQALLAHDSTTIGRKRGEFEKGTKAMLRARSGSESDAEKFWPIGAGANGLQARLREFNAMPKKRRAFGRDVVVPDDLYRTAVRRECPPDQLWRFCPVKRTAAIQRGGVQVSVKFYDRPFYFRVNGEADGLYLEHGYAVLIAFHPGHPERGCFIFNAATGTTNRQGYAFGELLTIGRHVEDAPQYGLPASDPDRQAIKKANATVAQEFRSIAGKGSRVSVVRDGRGRSVRLESGTVAPFEGQTARSLKEQRTVQRREQAEQYEREAATKAKATEKMLAELPAKRLAAKIKLGIFDDPEVMAAMEAERNAARAKTGA